MPTPLPRLPRLPASAPRHQGDEPPEDTDRGLPRTPADLFAPGSGGRAAAVGSSRPLVVAAVVAGLAVAWFTLRPTPPPDVDLPYTAGAGPASATAGQVDPAGEPPEGSSPSTSSATTISGDPAADLVVHAAGAVVTPGVYRLAAPARVQDVVLAAGGLAPDADVDRVNLAAGVVDGERVYVPRLGLDVPLVAGGGSTSSGNPTGTGSGDGVPPIDLNSADIDALDALPGVGPATAAAIVAYRDEHGLFGSVDELLEVRGIGEAKLEALRERVVVG